MLVGGLWRVTQSLIGGYLFVFQAPEQEKSAAESVCSFLKSKTNVSFHALRNIDKIGSTKNIPQCPFEVPGVQCLGRFSSPMSFCRPLILTGP